MICSDAQKAAVNELLDLAIEEETSMKRCVDISMDTHAAMHFATRMTEYLIMAELVSTWNTFSPELKVQKINYIFGLSASIPEWICSILEEDVPASFVDSKTFSFTDDYSGDSIRVLH